MWGYFCIGRERVRHLIDFDSRFVFTLNILDLESSILQPEERYDDTGGSRQNDSSYMGSSHLKNDTELKSLLEKIRDLMPTDGYKLKNPWQLNQFEILDDDLEKAFNTFIQRYESLTGEDLQSLKWQR